MDVPEVMAVLRKNQASEKFLSPFFLSIHLEKIAPSSKIGFFMRKFESALLSVSIFLKRKLLECQQIFDCVVRKSKVY